MVKVRALTKGYVGGMIREAGDVFEWPEGNKVGKWVKPVAFGGKGDNDGDGLTGGSKPEDGDGKPVAVPTDWQSLSAADKKALAKAISGNAVPNAKEAEAVISAHVEASKGEVFGDAPAPEVVQGNGVQEALGGPAPDWLPPSEDGDGKPVMAED